MSLMAVAIGGSAVVGAYASKKASKAQAGAAREATQAEQEMFEQNRQDQAPWRDAGQAGLNRLMFGLGLSPTTGGPATYQQTAEQIREELLPMYARESKGFDEERWAADMAAYNGPMGLGHNLAALGGVVIEPPNIANYMRQKTTDEAGLKAAIEQRMAEQKAKYDAEVAAGKADPGYGEFLRDFTKADMEADPVYRSGLQFGMDEGRKSLNNTFAASGKLLSGAAAKALTRFGNDYASTKANDSYNRFNNNRDARFNKLAGMSGTGQTSAAQIANQGAQMAHSVGNNMMGAGNARAAGYIGGANALTGAIGQGVNMYQGNQLMDLMRKNQQPASYLTNFTPSYAGTGSGGWTSGYDL